MPIEVTTVGAVAPTESATPAATPAPDAAAPAENAADADKAAAAAPDAAPDAPKAEEPKPDPKDAKVAARFAELARREATLTKREQAIKAQEAELTAYKQAAEAAKRDPRGVLKSLGISLRDLVDAELKDGQPETVEDRIARLERERAEEAEARKREAEERATAETTAVIERAKSACRQFVDAAPDRYELIATEQAHDEVFATIEEMYAATAKEVAEGKRSAPVVLSFEQAADMVEAHLLERAKRLAAAKKLAPKAPEPAAPAPEPAKPAPARKPSVTITAATTSAPAVVPVVDRSKLSKRERIERAAQKIRFTEKR